MNIEYATTVEAIDQSKDRVTVTFNTSKTAVFDLVVGADSLGSKIRRLLHGPENDDSAFIRSLGQYTAFQRAP